MDPRFNLLVEQLRDRSIDRRTFIVRAAALGASATAIGAGLARAGAVSAQDASPASGPGASPSAGGPATAAEIGVPGIERTTDTSKGTIRLYSSWPLTGASEQIGGDSAEAVRMAIEDRGNAAGGFAIEYEALDDGIAQNNGAWDPAQEADNANRAASDPDAMVYIGTYNSGAAKVAIPILNQASPGPMPMISPANTVVELTQERPTNPEGEPAKFYPSGTRNYMRVVPADNLQGGADANFAYSTLGARRAYVLHDNQTYGQGLATIFRDAFQQLGGEVLGFEGYDPEAPDYQALMTSVADQQPDVLFLGAIVNLNASKVLADMRSVMAPEDVAFVGPDGLVNQAFVDGAGDAAEGAYLSFAGLPPQELTGAGADWYERMKARVNREPDAYSVYSYEAAVVAIQAIDRVQIKDRAAILEAMFDTEGFQGLLGEWSFDENGDTSATTVSINVVKDGQITFQEVAGAAS